MDLCNPWNGVRLRQNYLMFKKEYYVQHENRISVKYRACVFLEYLRNNLFKKTLHKWSKEAEK